MWVPGFFCFSGCSRLTHTHNPVYSDMYQGASP
nr:MAG TPA: hypothetical protein [Caudoviricetes sp.]